ncbi:MAG TPA: AraC family transcriptional regulator [Thermoanaerobaculia bacterium]|nr:AraC family transcriptional regulator [Thermoanaerobaculia bacterium]
MPLHIPLKLPEKLLVDGEMLAVGTFRCPASDPLFHDSGPCNSNAIVFPRRVIRITHSNGRSFVADPTTIPLYNRGQRYERSAISSADHSDWIALSDTLLHEMTEWSTARRRGDEPFEQPCLTAPPALYVRQRLLFESLLHDPEVDSDAAEQAAVLIVTEALAPVRSWRSETTRGNGIVAAAKELLARHLGTNLPLREVAAAVGASPFRLCRLFKAATGTTLSEFRTDLRLRVALQLLARPAADILEIATQLGFSSHSHFSARFIRRFGLTPSAFRAQVR